MKMYISKCRTSCFKYSSSELCQNPLVIFCKVLKFYYLLATAIVLQAQIVYGFTMLVPNLMTGITFTSLIDLFPHFPVIQFIPTLLPLHFLTFQHFHLPPAECDKSASKHFILHVNTYSSQSHDNVNIIKMQKSSVQ